MLEQTFRTSSGVSLNIAVGPRAGPPIVLLHGVTRRWQDWLTALAAFTARWQVFAVDFRGHGRSGRSASKSYRIADYVPDLVEFLHRDLPEPAIVVGHS